MQQQGSILEIKISSHHTTKHAGTLILYTPVSKCLFCIHHLFWVILSLSPRQLRYSTHPCTWNAFYGLFCNLYYNSLTKTLISGRGNVISNVSEFFSFSFFSIAIVLTSRLFFIIYHQNITEMYYQNISSKTFFQNGLCTVLNPLVKFKTYLKLFPLKAL